MPGAIAYSGMVSDQDEGKKEPEETSRPAASAVQGRGTIPAQGMPAPPVIPLSEDEQRRVAHLETLHADDASGSGIATDETMASGALHGDETVALGDISTAQTMASQDPVSTPPRRSGPLREGVGGHPEPRPNGSKERALPRAKLSALPGELNGETARYRADREIGKGGMGRVLLVHDARIDREVAMKEMFGSPSEAAALRFIREARLSGRLGHPSIIPVHDLGVRDDGTLFYTMRHVAGDGFDRALKDCSGLAERLHYLPNFGDVCNAVAFAHSKNIIHRDLKPANILIGSFGETVVVDWGLPRSWVRRIPKVQSPTRPPMTPRR